MRNELLLNFKMLKDNYNEVRSLCDSYEREIKELKQKIKEQEMQPEGLRDNISNSEFGEITKGDLFGMIDYLHDGLRDYNEHDWVMRCSIWLNQKIKEM